MKTPLFVYACSSYIRRISLGLLAATLATAPIIHAADLSDAYNWNPVRIGSGGLVTGIVVHPLNASVRYCRTDVGNAYRWDTTLQEWIPMIVRNADGTGLPADVAAVPAITGCSSLAVDPSDTNVVLMAFPVKRDSRLTGYPSLKENVYRSTDGGRNFVKANLGVSSDPNGNSRNLGERIKFDPYNSNVVYYCTYADGLYRSADGGLTWTAVTAGGAPPAPADPAKAQTTLNIQFHPGGGTTLNTAISQVVTSVIYVSGYCGNVYRSQDGGQTWTNITAGTALSGFTGMSTIDSNGALWLPFFDPNYYGTRNAKANTVWKFSGTWSSRPVPVSSAYGQVKSVTVDPADPNRLFLVTKYGGFHRSTNGGTNWQNLGPFTFGNTWAWLPQGTFGRSNGGIQFDAGGGLWIVGGQEGVMRYTPTAGNTETSIPWIIESKGIEEMVAHDILVPKGSGDRVLTATFDLSGFRFTNPDKFTAMHMPVQTVQPISAGSGVAVCPNAIDYVTIFSTDLFSTGDTYKGWNFSASSTDGGLTWTPFGSNPKTFHAGNIAVSRRAGWGAGSDHIVMLPSGTHTGGQNGKVPHYSHDGGATWTPTTSFPMLSNFDFSGSDKNSGRWYIGYANAVTTQHALRADPFVADRFYLRLNIGGFYVSVDGGVNWTEVMNTNLPNWLSNGQLEVNYNLQNDLWYATGYYSNSPAGLYHSAPGTNHVFTRITAVAQAYTVALGAGRGLAGDAPYTVYFYGKLAAEAAWGVFRSTDAGATWDRISYYPDGVIDQPSCMAASWETFGNVYIGFLGHSYIYGRPKHNAFTQLFGSGTAMSRYNDGDPNRFTTIQQGTNGGFSVNANEELVMTDGTDTQDHVMVAKADNLTAPLDRGFIFKGTLRAVANPSSWGGQVFGFLQFGTYGTGIAMATNFRIAGTAAAPTACIQPANGLNTGYANASTGTPFWIVVNKTGGSVTYTRPDGQSKTLANNQYDLWFGSDGNNGAQLNKALYNTTHAITSFWFQVSGYYSAPGAAVAFDNVKVSTIDAGTTLF